MRDTLKKRFFLSHKKASALTASIALHAVFIAVAITFVAVKVYVKPEQTFVVPEVKRPQMKLRKLQVPVKDQKKTQAPKLRHTIVAKPKYKDVNIKMPEIIGVPGGTGYGRGEGLGGLGFGFEMDLFGGGRGSGNELIGTFYDLKQSSKGEPTDMDNDKYLEVIDRFLSSWNENGLKRYFQAPRNKYAVAFWMPNMRAEEAPKAYGVSDSVKPKQWLALYKGQISAPETGKYRFCGFADDVLYVRVKRRLVLDACWPDIQGRVSGWKSDDENSGKFDLSTGKMIIGDWINLTKDTPVDIEILIGERPGGYFLCHLMIEQQGKTYQMIGDRPILPVFRTKEIPDELAAQMKVNPRWATLDGPSMGVLR